MNRANGNEKSDHHVTPWNPVSRCQNTLKNEKCETRITNRACCLLRIFLKGPIGYLHSRSVPSCHKELFYVPRIRLLFCKNYKRRRKEKRKLRESVGDTFININIVFSRFTVIINLFFKGFYWLFAQSQCPFVSQRALLFSKGSTLILRKLRKEEKRKTKTARNKCWWNFY